MRPRPWIWDGAGHGPGGPGERYRKGGTDAGRRKRGRPVKYSSPHPRPPDGEAVSPSHPVALPVMEPSSSTLGKNLSMVAFTSPSPLLSLLFSAGNDDAEGAAIERVDAAEAEDAILPYCFEGVSEGFPLPPRSRCWRCLKTMAAFALRRPLGTPSPESPSTNS